MLGLISRFLSLEIEPRKHNFLQGTIMQLGKWVINLLRGAAPPPGSPRGLTGDANLRSLEEAVQVQEMERRCRSLAEGQNSAGGGARGLARMHPGS